ncbi:hypothetical protein B4135_3935 [Caldibacillus debilis]|uniref:Uncharacterized protein n=1 Tax=Caldibacillus debilis TaxID=301148 RepID=A0A150L9Q1_9BACI|nr:hypothetical protein B4135_3935 [Caldibacillus debilis]
MRSKNPVLKIKGGGQCGKGQRIPQRKRNGQEASLAHLRPDPEPLY